MKLTNKLLTQLIKEELERTTDSLSLIATAIIGILESTIGLKSLLSPSSVKLIKQEILKNIPDANRAEVESISNHIGSMSAKEIQQQVESFHRDNIPQQLKSIAEDQFSWNPEMQSSSNYSTDYTIRESLYGAAVGFTMLWGIIRFLMKQREKGNQGSTSVSNGARPRRVTIYYTRGGTEERELQPMTDEEYKEWVDLQKRFSKRPIGAILQT